jgi:putative membrane protein
MNFAEKERLFWSEAFAIVGSALPLVLSRTLLFGLFAALVTEVHLGAHIPNIGIEITPFEVAGGVLSLLLVLRTNAGNERWWEGRKLWGGIVNQSRNLVVAALSYGPADPAWRWRIARLTAAFAHASRRSLRGERSPTPPELVALLGPDEARRIASAEHMPSAVSRLIGESVRDARERLGLDGFGQLQIDEQRASLIDHIGGCERILKSPLPLAYRIETRRILILFLASLPFALVERIGWLTPLVTVLVALPMLSIDKIANELQFPFDTSSLNHLPLDDICATIERNVLALVPPSGSMGHGQPPPPEILHVDGCAFAADDRVAG